jgi:hypothetical protein
MTHTYTLDLDVDDASAAFLRRIGARIVVAKPAGNARPNVVWLALEPAARNTIRWDESYGIYAASNPDHHGAPIRMTASVERAEERALYPFLGAEFGPAIVSPHLPQRHYDVRNDAQFAATFGLLQTATVNGHPHSAPLNAAVLPAGGSADFTAVATLYVWTQSGVHGGSFAPEIPRDATIVTFDRTSATQRFRFAPATATFVP